MSDITLPLVVALSLATILASAATAWGVVKYRVSRNDKELALLKAELVIERDRLSAFMLEATQRFVTTETLDKMEMRVLSAIDRLGDRLDRAFEARAPRQRS